MKKIILLTLFLGAFSVLNLNAQLQTKNGLPILPEKGDWAISVSANPFLTYFGSFLSDKGGTSPNFNFLSGDNYIAGKYFVDDKTAYRVKLRLGLGSSKTTTMVPGVKDSTTQVENTSKVSSTNILLGFGIEKRRGKTRLQGIYGAEALLKLMGGGTTTNTYGNPIDSVNTFGPRNTEIKTGMTFGIGVRGFIGAEYFILPKLSIGAEYGWGLMFSSTAAGSVTTEYWDPIKKVVATKKVDTGKVSSFGVDTDISPVIMLTFHF